MAKHIAEEIRYPDEVERGEGGGVEPLIMTGKDGRIVSAASLRENPYTGEMYISYMTTNPELLGEGHGSEMFNRIAKMAADRGQGISLDATEHSAPFWEKMGGKVGKDGWYHWTPEEVKTRVEGKTPAEPKRISQMESTDVGIMKPDGSLVIGSRSNPEMPTPNEHADLVGGVPQMVEIMNNGGVRFGQMFEEEGNPGFVSISKMTPKGVENALKVIEQMPVNELTFEAYGDKNYFQADGSPKQVAGQIRKEMAKREAAEPAIEHPKAPVDIRELKYPEADKDAKTGEPITIHAYRASMDPEFRTNEARGTFFAPEATPEFGNHIYRAKLEFKNPLVADSGTEAAQALGDKELAKKYEDVLSGWDSEKDAPLEMPQDAYEVLDKQLAALAKKAGHDGIVFHGHDDLNPVQYIAVDQKAITNPEKVGQYSWSSLKVEPEEEMNETRPVRGSDVSDAQLKTWGNKLLNKISEATGDEADAAGFMHSTVDRQANLKPSQAKDWRFSYITKGDDLVAAGALKMTGKDSAIVHFLGSEEKGGGTAALKELEQMAVDKGAKKLSVEANDQNYKFYEKNGFKLLGEPSEDGVMMEKSLQPEEAAAEKEKPASGKFSGKASDFVDKDYLPPEADEDAMYHVTTAKDKVLAEGLKSRKETKTAGLGGGYNNQAADRVSVTFDEGHANQIAERMRLAVDAAKDKVTPQEVLDRMISDAMLSDDEPGEIGTVLGAPAEVLDDWDAFNDWLAEEYPKGDSYRLLQDLDDGIPKIYTEAENPVRVGFTASKEAMAKIDPDQIQILKVEGRAGAKPQHIPDEAELRFKPEDLRVAKSEKPAEDAGMKRLVEKLNAKDWWHVPPEQGEAAYAHRGKFMTSQYGNAELYGKPDIEAHHIQIKNPIVGTENEIAEKLGVSPQYSNMPYSEVNKLDREWAVAAKKAGYDAIVTVPRAALDKFLAGGRIPRNMEVQDLTHLDESLPTPKAQAHPDPIGIHEDDLPYRAKYASVDFDKPDMQDSGKRVTAESIKKDYVREKDRNKVSVYQSYIPMEDLPTPKFVSEEEENFDRQEYRPRIGSPIKVDIHPNGSVNILDGNHRVQVWGEQNQEYAPAWVIDHRHPGIEMLSEDEKAEREEED